MSDRNIRDFRNAHQPEPESAGSNRTFWSCVIAIPVIAAAAGLGYGPLMEMRTQNADMLAQAKVEAETSREMASTQRLAERMGGTVNADGLIDLNGPKGGRTKRVKPKPVTTMDYLTLKDARAAGMDRTQLSMLQYRRITSGLAKCGAGELRAFYERTNKPRFDRIREADRASRAARGPSLGGQNSELKKIKTRGDAMKFVASGGAMRHQARSMEMFSSMGSEINRLEVTMSEMTHDKAGCSQLRTHVQSGRANLR